MWHGHLSWEVLWQQPHCMARIQVWFAWGHSNWWTLGWWWGWGCGTQDEEAMMKDSWGPCKRGTPYPTWEEMKGFRESTHWDWETHQISKNSVVSWQAWHPGSLCTCHSKLLSPHCLEMLLQHPSLKDGCWSSWIWQDTWQSTHMPMG